MRIPRKLTAGELRHRIQLAAPTGAQDSGGSVPYGPGNFAVVWTCWGSVEAFAGGTSMAAQEFLQGSTHWITMRHPHGLINVTSQMQVWWSGRTWQINSVVNPTEQNKMLVLVCTEINQSQQQPATPVAP